ncbi:MAG: Short-chain alcohol dehydrogenase/reductase family (Fabg-like) protein [Pseudomonadota bacterium]|nr:Short-chain alcohol dehydrogenase/reductase family (Fabg-like) protein [Pseudomonadota bacterium]
MRRDSVIEEMRFVRIGLLNRVATFFLRSQEPPMSTDSFLSPRRVVLVTGGSRGLGRSAVLHLARYGWDVVFTYHQRVDAADALRAELAADPRTSDRRVAALRLDTSSTAGFARFVTELSEVLARDFGGAALDALVNNAGFGVHAPLAETTEAQFDALVNVHLKGVLFLTQALLPLLRDGGSILNVSSGLARFSLPGYGAYAMMKGAVEVMTRYLAKELGGRRIRVNTLAPGAIETDFGGGAVRDNQALNAMIASQTALGRVGLPDDIGAAVSALLSDHTGWINGQRIEASGGVLL